MRWNKKLSCNNKVVLGWCLYFLGAGIGITYFGFSHMNFWNIFIYFTIGISILLMIVGMCLIVLSNKKVIDKCKGEKKNERT